MDVTKEVEVIRKKYPALSSSSAMNALNLVQDLLKAEEEALKEREPGVQLIAYNPVTLESFIRSITEHREPYDPYDDGYIDAVDRIQEWLEQNTVDAAPVVHARWEWWGSIEIQGKVYDSYRCTRCKHKLPHIIPQGNYCLNCGAIMDLKER